MRYEETILFTDLDGTLFDSKTEVSPANRAAVERYIAAGGRFAIATGRASYNARRFTGDIATNAPSIVFNGAAVYDFPTGEYIFCDHMDRTALDPVFLGLMEAFPDLDLQLYTEEEITSVTPERNAQPDLRRLHEPVHFLRFEELAGAGLVKAVAWVPPARYDALGAWLREHAAGRCQLTPGSVVGSAEPIIFYELIPLHATKGSALRRLRSHPALAGRTVLAAGDYLNDLEMLAEADVPVCPANAAAEVKAVCGHIAVSNDAHAIADVIDRIIPGL